jgi:hypothetical protein
VTNEAEVYFALYGPDFDPDEVTRLVGLQPTSITRRSDPRPKQSILKVSSGKVENDVIDIYDMSSALVAKLAPYSDKIASARRQMNVEAVLEVVLWITMDETKSTPAIGFDADVLSFVVAVGATIDVDTYRNVP